MIRRLSLHGILSFSQTTFELGPLNVLIGPNASGKSNLVEVINLLRSAPTGILEPIHMAEDSREWFWKGETGRSDAISIEALIDNPKGKVPLQYSLKIEQTPFGAELVEEQLANERPYQGYDSPYLFFSVQRGRGIINVRDPEDENLKKRELRPEDLTPDQSVLRERRDPVQYPEITYFGKQLESVRIYRNWNTSASSPARQPFSAQGPNLFLNEDMSNLALVLNRMERDGTLDRIERELHRFYEGFVRLGVQIDRAKAQLHVKEHGMAHTMPATRISDGTLRFISLLSILCHPTPPPLICIEEPEIGLHPEVIPLVADLLQEASGRTQLVVTTHSEMLVNALSDDVESVVVCERGSDHSTEFRRLVGQDLTEWLLHYGLGDLWRKGEIGGTRW